jgi:hypothetical protein
LAASPLGTPSGSATKQAHSTTLARFHCQNITLKPLFSQEMVLIIGYAISVPIIDCSAYLLSSDVSSVKGGYFGKKKISLYKMRLIVDQKKW